MSSIIASTIQTAHSAAISLFGANAVSVGAVLPAHVQVKENDAAAGFEAGTKFAIGKIVIVGVPGAFTTPCNNHAPGYIEHAEDFATKGVSGVYIVSVNDAFVTKAWKENLAGGKPTQVHFIADDKGEFTAAIGMLSDSSVLLGGPRAKRYVIIAEDGKVTRVVVEPNSLEVTVTKADAILAQL
ncbi:hypothetical protein EW145_g8263 [Phellinidium pouzarii]|uniref:Thioredoxin domain-containing protein n=1 Tax=Phellinidium pouzarii TaxID=167371 RepID=A0A4S4K7R3_9AGAM|nr:hypothetical protein EW145_g8263 [Phellinidium pouzarii]